jgi:hypothetical protein
VRLFGVSLPAFAASIELIVDIAIDPVLVDMAGSANGTFCICS